MSRIKIDSETIIILERYKRLNKICTTSKAVKRLVREFEKTNKQNKMLHLQITDLISRTAK